jgi:RHS repeat-associated protein
MPIDIASGNVHTTFEDLFIPGKIPLVWARSYNGASIRNSLGGLGRAWTHRYATTLTRFPGGFQFVTPTGVVELLADPNSSVEAGSTIRHFGAFFEIFMLEGRYIVQTWSTESDEVRRYVFVPDQLGVPLRLVGLQDVSGQGLDLVWDEDGRLQSVRQRLEQRQLNINHNRAGLVDRVTVLLENGEQQVVASYEYDNASRLVAAYDAAEFADSFEYDHEHRLEREVIKDGGLFRYRYDLQGRCVLRTGLNHYDEKRLRYLDATRITEVTNSYGVTSRFQALPSGQIVKAWRALGAVRSTEYDDFGRISAKIDSTGAITRYGYDDQGNRALVVDALGQITRQTFNQQHLPLTLTDADGHIWLREYDVANRLIASIDPTGNRWQFDYDDDGNVCELINPLGARKTQIFDGGILRSIKDWNGQGRNFEFDAFGRVVERRDFSGEATRIRYDCLGRPTQIIHSDGSVICATYDHAGNLTKYVDPNGHTIRWRYGPCNRLLERIDPIGHSMRYVWGSERGFLDEIINANGEHYSFFRDDGGRVVREVSFDGAERQFTYNGEDRTTSYMNANGETVVLERDLLQRIVTQILPDGDSVSFQFNALGKLEQATTADISIRFERDVSGRITREVQGNHWIQSNYDAVGHLRQTTTSLGLMVDYTNDANGAVISIATGGEVHHIERNFRGQETARLLPCGLRLEQTYNSLGKLIEQELGNGSNELLHRRYHYDAAGQLSSLDDARWGRVDYIYDPAEHLIQTLKSRGSNETFDYDGTGNISRARSEGQHVVDEVRRYQRGDRLVVQGDTRFEYDAEGRLIKKIEQSSTGQPRIWTYVWNALDRLKCVTDPDGTMWRYRYDAMARRIAKELVNGPLEKKRIYLWDKERIVHEADAVNHSLSAWIYGDARFAPLLTVQNGQSFSIVHDQLGTPREFISASGLVALSRTYTTWGKIDTQFVSPKYQVTCPIVFQGHWHDEETGLHYNKFRYYSPDCGCYISQDPLGILGGANFYAYGTNSINWLDPLGLCASHDSGQRGRDAAEADLLANGHTIMAEEVTMIVNGQRVRADFVTTGPDGVTIHVFEVKNGTGRLTDNQAASGVYDMHSPANASTSPGGGIDTSSGTSGTLTVATSNPDKTTNAGLPARGGTQPATFSVLQYDV